MEFVADPETIKFEHCRTESPWLLRNSQVRPTLASEEINADIERIKSKNCRSYSPHPVRPKTDFFVLNWTHRPLRPKR